jgi:hypothetical protein
MNTLARSRAHDSHDSSASPDPAPVGRRSLTQGFAARPRPDAQRPPSGARELDLGAAVQRKITTRGADVSREEIGHAASRGIATSTGALPFADRIQASFGSFDVGGIAAHTGREAAETAAQMGAEAYAVDNHVVLGDDPSLHTVAHEVAHVAQQRAGVARKSDAPGDEWERHADAVADRVVAGESAEDLLAPLIAHRGTGGGDVQRKITQKGKELGTWAKVSKSSAATAANAVMDAARKLIGGSVVDKTLSSAWNNLAKNAKKSFELDTEASELAQELAAGYQRSANAKERAANRGGNVEQIVEPLLDAEKDLELKPSPRNPTVQPRSTKMGAFTYDPKTPKEDQLQRQIANVVLDKFGGVEVQTSFAKDGHELLVSTNTNDSNKQLATNLKSVADLMDLCVEVADQHGLDRMSNKEAMNDRVVRHAMKIFDRLKGYLADDADLVVPPAIKEDGRHAEIRIEQSEGWTPKTHRLPTGTKLPCVGCKLYFSEEGHAVSMNVGFGWITDAALSTQIEKVAKGAKISEMTSQQLDAVGELLAAQFENHQHQIVMGKSKTKDGMFTTDVQADSESELDEKKSQSVRAAMKKRKASGDPNPKSSKSTKLEEDSEDSEMEESEDSEDSEDEESEESESD